MFGKNDFEESYRYTISIPIFDFVWWIVDLIYCKALWRAIFIANQKRIFALLSISLNIQNHVMFWMVEHVELRKETNKKRPSLTGSSKVVQGQPWQMVCFRLSKNLRIWGRKSIYHQRSPLTCISSALQNWKGLRKEPPLSSAPLARSIGMPLAKEGSPRAANTSQDWETGAGLRNGARLWWSLEGLPWISKSLELSWRFMTPHLLNLVVWAKPNSKPQAWSWNIATKFSNWLATKVETTFKSCCIFK